jgi:hypothetical protein
LFDTRSALDSLTNQPNMLDQFLVNKNMAIGDAPIEASSGNAPKS